MITIVDYGMGNLGSIQNMIKKLGHSAIISSKANDIIMADKVILPGVGSFDKAIQNLRALNLIDTLKEYATTNKPMLGICLGMQLLSNGSEEGTLPGLGLIPGEVKRFKIDSSFKIPHMGWNLIQIKKTTPLLKQLDSLDEIRFYFVHSYYYQCDHDENIMTTTSYDKEFTSGVNHGAIYGVQFHPEKSHKFGMQLIKNFLEEL